MPESDSARLSRSEKRDRKTDHENDFHRADDLRAIAMHLLEIAAQDDPAPSVPSDKPRTGRASPPKRDNSNEFLKSLARFIYQYRRRREQYFDPELFGELAWDMLLDLFIAKVDGKRVSVTSLCVASAGPSTTALRYITLLTDEGLIRREQHEGDARVKFLELTDAGFDAMRRFLAGEVAAYRGRLPFMIRS
ncbi:MarR family transcriptional regulator [Tsuneonella sp. HG094]